MKSRHVAGNSGKAPLTGFHSTLGRFPLLIRPHLPQADFWPAWRLAVWTWHSFNIQEQVATEDADYRAQAGQHFR